MLTREDDVDAHALHAKGWKISAIARHLGHDRKTTRAHLFGGRVAGERVKASVDEFDRFAGYVGERLREDPHLWATTLFEHHAVVHEPAQDGGSDDGVAEDLARGRTASVPGHLPDLSPREAVRVLDLPLHLEWSRPGRSVNLADRRRRALVYEVVLREGRPADIESIVDGALPVDLWDELVLPRRVRAAWEPIVDSTRGSDG